MRRTFLTAHHGWLRGYSFAALVSATPGTTVCPLLASADVASAAEAKTFAQKIDNLPPQAQCVSANCGYDANGLAERVEYDEYGRRTGRRFQCSDDPRNTGRPKTKPGGADAARVLSLQRRAARKRSFQSPKGRRTLRRRSKTVDPFNALFVLHQRVRHRGLGNNQTRQVVRQVSAFGVALPGEQRLS